MNELISILKSRTYRKVIPIDKQEMENDSVNYKKWVKELLHKDLFEEAKSDRDFTTVENNDRLEVEAIVLSKQDVIKLMKLLGVNANG